MKQHFSSRCGRTCAGTWLAAAFLLWAANALSAPPPQLPSLTTVPGSPRLPGKFVWADLVTDDVPAARKFYAQLFGWTFRDVGNYSIAANDECPLCGMVQAPPRAGTNGNPRWVGYISVPSVARARKAALKAGGKELVAARKFPKRGEQAIFADPEGAVFGVMTSSSGDPEDFLADPGDWIWIQLLCRNARKAAEFYRAVAGYEVMENSDSQRENDFVLVSGKFARATVVEIPQNHPQVRSAWLPFVRVKTITASVTQAQQLGGKVVLAPKAELFAGKIAVIADPTGAAIGLLEWDTTSQARGTQR
jgi:predicted enzyme related to lactoylglutathione lyase